MKKIFNTHIDPKITDIALLLLRVVGGGFMLTHGTGKLQKLMNGEMAFMDVFGIGEPASLVLAVFAEFFCAILLMVGLGTRIAASALVVTMAVAAFVAHADDPFGKKEMALLYLTIYVFLLAVGAGRLSLDRLLEKRLK